MPSNKELEDRAEHIPLSSDGELLSAKFCLDCGMLNRVDAVICQRCGSPLVRQEDLVENLPALAEWRYRLSDWLHAPVWEIFAEARYILPWACSFTGSSVRC